MSQGIEHTPHLLRLQSEACRWDLQRSLLLAHLGLQAQADSAPVRADSFGCAAALSASQLALLLSSGGSATAHERINDHMQHSSLSQLLQDQQGSIHETLMNYTQHTNNNAACSKNTEAQQALSCTGNHLSTAYLAVARGNLRLHVCHQSSMALLFAPCLTCSLGCAHAVRCNLVL